VNFGLATFFLNSAFCCQFWQQFFEKVKNVANHKIITEEKYFVPV
jgi:hypothetical protein